MPMVCSGIFGTHADKCDIVHGWGCRCRWHGDRRLVRKVVVRTGGSKAVHDVEDVRGGLCEAEEVRACRISFRWVAVSSVGDSRTRRERNLLGARHGQLYVEVTILAGYKIRKCERDCASHRHRVHCAGEERVLWRARGGDLRSTYSVESISRSNV